MNKGSTLVGVIEALVALLIIFLAWLIKYKKQVNIIAGYDEQTCKDKDGLAAHVGGTLLFAGSIAFILALAVIFFPGYTNIIVGGYAVAIVLGAIIAAVGGSKYQR